jgi:hypothetical protein
MPSWGGNNLGRSINKILLNSHAKELLITIAVEASSERPRRCPELPNSSKDRSR